MIVAEEKKPVNTQMRSTSMWYEQLPQKKSWSRLWSDYTICGHCFRLQNKLASALVCVLR